MSNTIKGIAIVVLLTVIVFLGCLYVSMDAFPATQVEDGIYHLDNWKGEYTYAGDASDDDKVIIFLTREVGTHSLDYEEWEINTIVPKSSITYDFWYNLCQDH